jgi:transposase
MARTGRPLKISIELTNDERSELERLARRARTNRHLALRARIILASASGLSNLAVARKVCCADSTVRRWRTRFLERRVAGLFEEPRPGAPRRISDDDVERIIVETLETKPKGRTHWSTRSMAENAGISHSTVGRIWRTFGLQPHVVKSFKISDDPPIRREGS